MIRSGCDFKQLSYIEARKKSKDGTVPGWNFDIIRRDITSDMYNTLTSCQSLNLTAHRSQDEATSEIVNKLTSGLKAKLAKPIGFTAVPLDARFSTVRAGESNIANFVYVSLNICPPMGFCQPN